MSNETVSFARNEKIMNYFKLLFLSYLILSCNFFERKSNKAEDVEIKGENDRRNVIDQDTFTLREFKQRFKFKEKKKIDICTPGNTAVDSFFSGELIKAFPMIEITKNKFIKSKIFGYPISYKKGVNDLERYMTINEGEAGSFVQLYITNQELEILDSKPIAVCKGDENMGWSMSGEFLNDTIYQVLSIEEEYSLRDDSLMSRKEEHWEYIITNKGIIDKINIE